MPGVGAERRRAVHDHGQPIVVVEAPDGGSTERDQMLRQYDRLVRRIDQLDRVPLSVMSRDGRPGVHEAAVFASLVSAAKGVLAELDRMKAADHRIVAMPEEHAVRCTTCVASIPATGGVAQKVGHGAGEHGNNADRRS